MAARWQIATNSFLRGARWRQATYLIVLMALLFLCLAALALSYGMTVGIVELTNSARATEVIVSSAFSGGLLLSIVVSFTVALAALYLSRDLDMLLTAPVPRRAVFFSKLFGGLLPSNLMVLGFTLIPLVGYGLAMRSYEPEQFGLPYYAAVLLALALLPLLPMTVGALSVMLIVRRVPAQRLGEVVGLVVVAMTLSIALVAGSARQLQQALTFRDLLGVLERFRAPWSPAEWLTNAVVAAGQLQWGVALGWFALLVGLSVLGLALLNVASDRLYYEGWLRMQSADQRRDVRRGRWLPWTRVDRAETLSRPSGLLALLPGPTVAVVRKDMRLIPRDLTNMAQVLSPLAIGLFFILQQLLYPIRVGGVESLQPFTTPLLSMLSATIASGVAVMIMSRFGLTAFSSEGRSHWVLKGSPISARQVLVGKFLVGYVPYLLLGTALLLLLNGARAVSDARLAGGPFWASLVAQMRPDMVLYGGLVMAVVGAGCMALTLGLGAARPNLRWDTPHEMLTPDLGCMSLVLYGGYMGLAGLALGLPAAVSGFPVLRYVPALWALGLTIGLGLTVVAVAGSFWLASAELASIGE
jgi:ABC-2 type transport system permease protein